MAWDPLTYADLVSGKPVKAQSFGQKINNCLNYLYGVIGALSSVGVPNGSFEVDSDSNSVPDNWTRTLYPGGTGGMAGSPNAAHGAYSFYFTHPGGVGCGGGYLESDYLECTEYATYYVSLLLWANAALKNMILVYYYDAGKVHLTSGSPVTLHSSTSYYAAPTRYIYQFTPSAGARYMKIFIIGGYTDTNVAGTMMFDDVQIGVAFGCDGRIMASAIDQTRLKTSYGEVSSEAAENLTLPGGEYGFYPQTKGGGSGGKYGYIWGEADLGETYITNIFASTAESYMVYHKQRYISASGEDHWIYLLKNRETGRITCAYQAPDHPSANTQALHTEIPHPFPTYDPAKYELILADNDILNALKPHLSRKNGILTLINKTCLVDDAKSAEYDYRIIKKINEHPDDPFGGEVVSMMKTPQWAKIAIRSDEIAIEQFAIEKLPEVIQYRKLYFDEKKLTKILPLCKGGLRGI